MVTSKAGAEWKAHWTLVLAATVGMSVASLHSYIMGLFMEPLGAEFGWTRTQVSAGLTIVGVTTLPLAPFLGVLIDRFGTRRLGIAGLALTSCTIAAFGLANGSMVQWLTLWFVHAIVHLGCMSPVWTAAITGTFTAARGLALGITMCGAAAAQIFGPVVSYFLIEQLDWRSAFFAIGFGWGGLAMVLSVLFLFDAHAIKSAARLSLAEGHATATSPGLSLKEAMRSTTLWRIAAASFLTMALGVGVMVHQVPILTEAGVSRSEASFLAGLAGVAAIAGKIVTGYLLDRMGASSIGGLTLAASAGGFALLLGPGGIPLVIILAMLIIGYSTGAKLQISAYLTGRYAGTRNFGKIFGLIFSLLSFGAALGPALAGIFYDVYGSYAPLLTVGIPGSIISGLLITRLGPYPEWGDADRSCTST